MAPSPPTELRKEGRVARAEWIAGASVLISLAGIAYLAGAQVQRTNDQDRRINDIEVAVAGRGPKLEQVLVGNAQITAQIEDLKEQFKEWREERLK